MYYYENENIIIYPVHFISYYAKAKTSSFPNCTNIYITEQVCYEISRLVNEYEGNKYIALDMSNIDLYPMHSFSEIKSNNSKVFFFNVSESVSERLKEDINSLDLKSEFKIAIFSKGNFAEIYDMHNEYCLGYRKEHLVNTVKKYMVCNDQEAYKLESSGLYSNFYLSMKKILREVEPFYYIVYSLSEMINQKEKYDAFITSSKNGAIIAGILSTIFNVKVIHLVGAGPKYSMELGDSLDGIKPGKRYLYIFDFMCTGTEYKVVTALVNSKKAFISGAVGISRFLDDGWTLDRNTVDVLVKATDIGLNYSFSESEATILNETRK